MVVSGVRMVPLPEALSPTPLKRICGSVLLWMIELMVGFYSLQAVTALRAGHLSMGGWIAAAVLLGVLASIRIWMRRKSAWPRWTVETALLAIGVGGALVIPGWTAGWGERVFFVLVARGLAGMLRIAMQLAARSAEPDEAEQLRVLLLFALTSVTLLAYLSPYLVGPKDARWYGNVAIDFLTQVRSGKFPVFSGETIYAFNGVVQTIRSAPWLLHFTALIDVLTLRALTPLAAEHIAVIASYIGAVLLFYIALVRLQPNVRWTAFLLVVIYAISPSIMMPLVVHDMFMTAMVLPVAVLVYHATARAMEGASWRAYAWIGVGCAAMWLCHPPIAFLTMAVVAACLMARFAIGGPTVRQSAGAIVAAGLFGGLAAPYFYSMSELGSVGRFDPVPNLILPALALFLFVLALAQAFVRRSFRWLALLPTVWLTLRDFKPSLLPFSVLVAGFFAVLVIANRFWPKLALRARLEPWFIGVFFAAAAAVAAWFPDASLPARKSLAWFINESHASWLGALQAIVRGDDCQPHAVWWLLLLVGLVLVWRTQSVFARLAFGAALVAIVMMMPVPLLSLFIWGNATDEMRDVLGISDWPRRWAFCLPVLLFAVYPMLAELAKRPKWHKAVMGGVLLLLPWALWDHVGTVRRIYAAPQARSDQLYRPENVVLQTYSWDQLPVPYYFSYGAMDPRLETRLWRQGGDHALLIDPDAIAREMEKFSGENLHAQPTRDPTYLQWVYLSPKVELKAGEHKLLRFDFHGRPVTGWLLVRGQDIYREYVLPASGLARAFGCSPLNTHTVSIWNSGTTTESLEIVFKREGTNATAEVRPEDFPDVIVSRYQPERAPIEVKSLSPLSLRVNAPEAGMLELFRSNFPGYHVSLNGEAVRHIFTRQGLIAFRVPAGQSEVLVRFRGTWMLRAMFWYGLVAWSIVAMCVAYTVAAELRSLRARERTAAPVT